MAFESVDHFASMWHFFLSRYRTRNWLCDPSAVPIAHAQYPPLWLSVHYAEAQLLLFGQEGPVSLGALFEDALTSQLAEVIVRRSALAPVPGSDHLFISAFCWLRSGALLVQFGTVTRAASGIAFQDVHTPHHMACRWDYSRAFDPPSARAIMHASRIGDDTMFKHAMSATFPESRFLPSLTETMRREQSQPEQNHCLHLDTVLSLPNWSPISEGDQSIEETTPISASQIYPEDDNPALLCDADQLIGLLSSEPKYSAAEIALSVKEYSFNEAQRKDASPGARNIKVELSSSKVPSAFANTILVSTPGQWSSSRCAPAPLRSRFSMFKKPRAAPLTLECPTCGVKIRGKRGNLNRHIAARHEDTREFSCAMPACNLSFHSKLNLLRHMTRVHEGRPHRCKQCPRAFRSADNLSKHLRGAHSMRREFVCNVCAVGFGRRSVLDNHVSSVHGDAEAVEFSCALPSCAERFESWKKLAAHETEMHDDRVHQCTKCTMVFETECGLSRHIRTDHGHTKMSCKCPVCGCFYSQKSNLLRHFALAHKSPLIEEEEV